MSRPEMVEVMEQVRAPLVIPMHYFGEGPLAASSSWCGTATRWW